MQKWWPAFGLLCLACGAKEPPAAPIPVAPVAAPANRSDADARSDAGPKAPQPAQPEAATGCEEKKCTGLPSADLEEVLVVRARSSHKCYDQALVVDSALTGNVDIQLRIGMNGLPCSVAVAKNTTGNDVVAACIASVMKKGAYPAPSNGCLDVRIPTVLKPLPTK